MTFNGGDISISYEHHCSIINKKRELTDLVHVYIREFKIDKIRIE